MAFNQKRAAVAGPPRLKAMADHEDRRISVLFVCLGNICRSPMAEAVFKYSLSWTHRAPLELTFDL